MRDYESNSQGCARPVVVYAKVLLKAMPHNLIMDMDGKLISREHMITCLPSAEWMIATRVAAKRWQLVNVGQGPALSIVVGDKAQNGKWANRVQYFPIAAGAAVELDSLQDGDQFVAVYTDIRGNAYSSFCSASENRFSQSNDFPDLTATVDEVTLKTMRENYRRKF